MSNTGLHRPSYAIVTARTLDVTEELNAYRLFHKTTPDSRIVIPTSIHSVIPKVIVTDKLRLWDTFEADFHQYFINQRCLAIGNHCHGTRVIFKAAMAALLFHALHSEYIYNP
ncbi:hypothetical protein N7504_004954 [Penicillium tannophilum]|nr:hypothetical protein N7504_004954 [Penicillium tannophilum]